MQATSEASGNIGAAGSSMFIRTSVVAVCGVSLCDLSKPFPSRHVAIFSRRPTWMTVQSYFQSRADWFHDLYEEDQPFRYRVNRVVRGAIYERVALTLNEFRGWKDFTVLDVGCGPGRNSVAFVQAGAARVVGVDFSERMLEIAREFSRS